MRVQRGLLHNHHQPPYVCSGVYIHIYCMRILCYESSAEPPTKQQLWLCAEWMSYMPGGAIRFYIREDRASLALCADAGLKRKPHLDYIL